MRLFGLIGHPLTHSFSKNYFTEKFEKEGMTGYRYELFPLKTIGALPFLLRDHPELEGLNVTIPYKQQVLPLLTEIHIPEGLPACNCINISGERLVGYNTDITGFEKSLRPLLRSGHKKALVLGSGGASAAVTFVLQKLGIGFTIVSRKPQQEPALRYAAVTREVIREHNIIINTTPLGMFPDEQSCPEIPYQFVTASHLFYDLVYNPAKTLFLQKGEAKGAAIKNGEEMLVLQAEESWRIWNG